MISIYLYAIKILYRIFILLPVRSRTVCIVTYGDNVWPILEELSLKGHSSYCFYDIQNINVKRPDNQLITYIPKTIWKSLFVIPFYVATSTHCIVDNYVVELAAMPIRKRSIRMQVWHAAGTLKLFGLQASQNRIRKPIASKRFREVYQNYGQFIVPGKKSAQQFADALDLPMNQFKSLGMPRTDQYFNRDRIIEKDERIVLYAPTYRENDRFEVTEYILNLHETLSKHGYKFMVKLHPSVNVSNRLNEVKFIDSKESILPYVEKAEWVITDYSSIPFEACLFHSKMILFVPDFEEYSKVPGVISNYETIIDVPIVHSVDELIDSIVNNRHGDLDWAKTWYDLEPGKATTRIINEFY